MNNFEKKLEDATEEELNRWINERNPSFGTLASNELTRRSLRRLQETIERADVSASKFNRITTAFTVIIMFMTYVQVVVALYEVFGRNKWILLVVFFAFAVSLLGLFKFLDKKIL